MESSHVRAEERPSKRGRERSARRNVSWTRSSAPCGSLLSRATYRRTSFWVARMNRSTASASPPRAASAHAVTVSSSRTAAPGAGGRAGAGDDGGVHCREFRTAVSARLDGEEPPPEVSGAALEAHLAGCADCRDWDERARRLKVLVAGLNLG